jgi:colicin import membrane protein
MARPRGISRRDRDSEGEESAEPTAGGSGPAPAPAPPTRRGDTQERIRVAAADAADAAEQRAIEEILALEEALKSAKAEAGTKLSELQQRLAESEERASAAERDAQAAHARVKELRAAPPPGESTSGRITHGNHEARLAAELRLRTEELEREREEKTRLIEESDRRLAEIEERAADAAQRVAAAEAELAQEAERLRTEAERVIAGAGEGAEMSAEDRVAATTARIVRLAWRAWIRWGAPVVASLRSLIRSGTSPR